MKKPLNFVQMFNKIKDTEEYKLRIRWWNSVNYYDKTLFWEKMRIKSLDNDFIDFGWFVDGSFLADIKSAYNYFSKNVKKSKN